MPSILWKVLSSISIFPHGVYLSSYNKKFNFIFVKHLPIWGLSLMWPFTLYKQVLSFSFEIAAALSAQPEKRC